MSLSAYLAKNYLTADPPTSDPSRPKKKRKKNHDTGPTTGLIIADDDEDLALAHTSTSLQHGDDPDAPIMYAPDLRQGRSAEFRKKKQSGWKAVSDSGVEASPKPVINGTSTAGAEEADSIIQAAAREQESRRLADEEGDAPTIVGDVPDDDKRPRMAGGGRGGLQTAADTRALEAARQIQKDDEEKKSKKKRSKDHEIQQQETVYRDATGRRIDIHMKRAEARKAEEEARKKELEEKEKLGGDVQRRQREDRKQELEDAKLLSIARYADDEDLNRELKERERWGDTMAGYTEKESGGGRAAATGTAGSKPIYKGAFQPNRYGIRPGHRWDGVDRGNGFEKEWFQARSRKERNRDLDYQWQMDE